MRRFVRATCAAALMAAAGLAVPLHAAAAVTNVPTGGGAMSLTFSTTSSGLPIPGAGGACITMSVSGLGEWNVVGAGPSGAYAGPITVSGSYDACGNSAIDSGPLTVSITGNPLFGDLSCTGSGTVIREVVTVTSVITVSCEIAGAAQPRTNIVYVAPVVPLSVDAAGTLYAYTTAGPVAFSV